MCKWPLAERWMDPHLGEPCSPRHRSSKMTLLPFCHKLSISWTRHPQHQSNKVWFSFSLFSRDQFFHLSFALNWHLIYVACLSLAPSTLFGEQYLLFTWISCNAYYAYMHVFLNQSLPFKTVQCFSGVLSIPISNVRKVPPGGRERESEVRFILLCFQTATNLRRAEIEME